MNTDTAEGVGLIDKGIEDASDPTTQREINDVDRWWKKLVAARKYDEPARQRYAKDRRYARGDSGFMVDANIVGTNIDILESFLYFKDPDVDVLPARAVQPPGPDAVRDMVEQQFEQQGGRPPEVMEAGRVAAAVAVQNGMPTEEAIKIGMMAENAKAEEIIEGEVEKLQARYARRMRDAKVYGETIELVVSKLWRDASLKSRGRRVVRSGLTIGIGVAKASWQERTAPAPETITKINDLQANIAAAARLRDDMDEASGVELDEKVAEYNRQLQALKGEQERVIARGFVVDQVAGENFQVAPGYQIANHLDAPWNAERIPMLKEDAKATFHLTAEEIGCATFYSARKPVMSLQDSGNVEGAEPDAKEADGFTTGEGGQGEGNGEWVMVWEIHDRETSHILTMIEGVKRWVKPPFQPTPTTRFYPYFLFCTSEVDGQRHPQSLVTRASKLVDEYNRIGSQEAKHRARIIPKMLFLKGQVGAENMTTITAGETGEFVGIETTAPNANISSLFAPLQYPMPSAELYDRTRIVAEIERIFGVQEALSGAVTVAKTATEAEIQQGGFQARTGGRRDLLEMMLQDLAQYTAEVARKHLDADDVREIAGPDALWPEYVGPRDLDSLVRIEIRAGSSGKPNTTAEREAWAQQLPMLQESIMQIGQLRNSTPADVAECLETLLKITAERSGDRIDIEQLVPKPGPPPAPMPAAAPGDPAANDPAQPQPDAAGNVPATA